MDWPQAVAEKQEQEKRKSRFMRGGARILDILAMPDHDRAGALVAWCRELEG